jgi:hypothetical protein
MMNVTHILLSFFFRMIHSHCVTSTSSVTGPSFPHLAKGAAWARVVVPDVAEGPLSFPALTPPQVGGVNTSYATHYKTKIL